MNGGIEKLKPSRKAARARLKAATRAEYERLIYAAKLTPRQEEIINLHILRDCSVCKIALRLSCCQSLVRKELAGAYEKIAFL